MTDNTKETNHGTNGNGTDDTGEIEAFDGDEVERKGEAKTAPVDPIRRDIGDLVLQLHQMAIVGQEVERSLFGACRAERLFVIKNWRNICRDLADGIHDRCRVYDDLLREL